MVMSALPLKADMCSAAAHVRYGPEADTGWSTRSPWRFAALVLNTSQGASAGALIPTVVYTNGGFAHFHANLLA
jgi:hypothetical protein